jgi:septal ring factor EnvC (AmiA/AmiB activator)
MEDRSGGLPEVADADLGRPVPIDEMKSNNDGGGTILQPKRAEDEHRMERDQRELEETIAQLRNQLAEALDRSSKLEVDLRQLTTQLQREQELRTTGDVALQQLSTQLAAADATLEAARSQAQRVNSVSKRSRPRLMR